MIVECYILDRQTHMIKNKFRSANWSISRDYLTNPQSSFTPLTEFEAKQGDYFVVKTNEHIFTDGYAINQTNQDIIKPIYFGVINSFENKDIICCEIQDLLNFTFPATYKSGNNLGQHLYNLLFKYLTSQPSQLVRSDIIDSNTIDATSQLNWVYSPESPPTETNLATYFQDAFSKYGVTWNVDNIARDEQANIYKINTKIKQPTKTFNIKNNSAYFVNWDVYVAPINYGFENKLLIVDIDTKDMEQPIILDTYYIQIDGTLTQVLNDNVYKPCKQKIVFFDTKADNNPTYLELAQQNLSRTEYSHEINVNLLIDNPLINVNELELGIEANIMYEGTLYKSILTGYDLTSDGIYITLHFGNIRSSLKKYI